MRTSNYNPTPCSPGSHDTLEACDNNKTVFARNQKKRCQHIFCGGLSLCSMHQFQIVTNFKTVSCRPLGGNIESPPVWDTFCLAELIYDIINRQFICGNCPKPAKIQYPPSRWSHRDNKKGRHYWVIIMNYIDLKVFWILIECVTSRCHKACTPCANNEPSEVVDILLHVTL